MSLLGKAAPDFSLFSDEKQRVDLENEVGSGPVVLLFFPAAFTGVCTTELNMVSNDLDAYSGARVFGISTDTPFTLAEYRSQNKLSFGLLSDHSGNTAAAYGCKYDNNFTGMKLDRIARRAAFVLDKEGNVVYEEVLENAGDLPNLEAVKKAASQV